MDWDDIKQRLEDRYTSEELTDILGIPIQDILETYQDIIIQKITEGELDIGEDYASEEEEWN